MVHSPGAIPESIANNFRERGVTLVEMEPFGEGPSRYCNKIVQLKIPELIDADIVILSDADIGFLRDPADLAIAGKFRAKLVDYPVPSEKRWREILKKSGMLNKAKLAQTTLLPRIRTFNTNFNGGLYFIPGESAEHLAKVWERHARFCLDQTDILGRQIHHSDQLGMGLAILELNLPIQLLSDGDNLPVHIHGRKLERIEKQRVTAIHYHREMDNHGLPAQLEGPAWIARAQRSLRNSISQSRRDGFLNELFWDFRYANFPELGSGLGSRDKILRSKRIFFDAFFDEICEDSFLDVGCGDLEVLRTSNCASYTGIDLSIEAIRICREKRPDWTFRCCDIRQMANRSFDHVAAIDVLIHQPSRNFAQAFVENLLRVARKSIVISFHALPPKSQGISFDSSWLMEYLSSHSQVGSITEFLRYRDTILVQAKLH